MRRYLLGAVGALLLAVCPATIAEAAPAITHYAMPLAGSQPVNVSLGGDGNIWFTEAGWNGVGKITPGGTVTEWYNLSAQPNGIATGASGNYLWFTETGLFGAIGRISTGGTVSEFSAGLTLGSDPTSIAKGADGNLWFTESGGNGAIGRINGSGVITEFRTGLTPGSQPWAITPGPDGALWFTEKAGRIGRITTQGNITEYSAGISPGAVPQFITAGPDGNLWFTEGGGTPRIGRITRQGVVTEFSAGLSGSPGLRGIAAGRDGNIYFAERNASSIGRITPSGAITHYSTGFGSGPYGITTGADGNLWFANLDGGTLGRMTVGPGVGGIAASGLTDTDVQVAAGIAPNSQATSYYFEYGTTTAYGSSTTPVSAGSGADSVKRTGSLAGLAPGTTYHVRAVATNATGTTAGRDYTFTTTVPGAPSATTDDATGVTSANATLAATVNPQTLATTYRFEWGPTPSYGASLPHPDGSIPGDGADHALSQPLTGLEPNTTYYYRVVATSTSGTTYGDQASFTTDAVAPDASTGSASGVTDSGATLAGTLNPRNSDTGWHFDYGRNAATLGSSAPDPDATIAADNSAHAVSQPITGLEPNTTYHYRLVGSSNAGTTTDAQKVFKTRAIAPGVEAAGARDVTATTATLAGAVNPHNSDSQYRFEWGESTAYGHSSPLVDAGDDNASHSVALPLDSLTPATTYHYRVVAISDAGETTGEDRGFTTAEAPPEPEPAPPTTEQPPAPDPAPPTPELGTTVVASPATGTVRVRAPGEDHYTTLGVNDVVPVGAKIDTRRGAIDLVSALADGSTQKAKFWNGVFTVRQSKKGKGYTDIYVAPATGCKARSNARKSGGVSAARKKKKKRRNSLWGRDDHGRYRGHGRGSVATVRGTTWLMEERCAGSYTKVKEGKVSVRDRRRHRTVLVRAGHSYLARTRR
jgi:virginiamycin B lyase